MVCKIVVARARRARAEDLGGGAAGVRCARRGVEGRAAAERLAARLHHARAGHPQERVRALLRPDPEDVDGRALPADAVRHQQLAKQRAVVQRGRAQVAAPATLQALSWRQIQQ